MRARRTFAAIAAVAVGLAQVSTPAAGATAPGSGIRSGAAPASPAAAGRLAADPAVASLAAEKRISLQAAEVMLEWQDRASDLDALLATTVTTDLNGGVWIGDDGRVKVGIVQTGTAEQIAAATAAVSASAAASGLTGATDVVLVRYSLSALLAANGWLGDQIEVVNQGVEWPLETEYTTAANVVRLGLPATGSLSAAQQTMVAQARLRYGAMLQVYTYTERPQLDDCFYPGTVICDPPLRAGIHVNPPGCTLGFLARSRSDGKLYAFTAGHCVYNRASSTIYSTLFTDNSVHNIGPMHNYVFGRLGDAAILRVTNEEGWRARAWVSVVDSVANGGVAGTEFNDQYPIRRDGASRIGMRVCHSGIAVRTSCGKVLALGVAHTYNSGRTVRGMAKTNYCRGRGDSGGPVYASGTAYGLHGAGSGCTGYYQGIRAAENLMNVNVAFES
jgi:hypothetical protein